MSKSALEVLWWLFYSACAVGLLALLWKTARPKLKSESKEKNQEAPKVLRSETKKSGLQSDILKEGSGPKAKNGDKITCHYRAFLTTGQEVDSSYERGRTVEFKLGAGKMIAGWETALIGAQAGEVRKVTVPASLAYGKKGSPSGKVPPNSTVVFDIELIKINS